MNVDELIDQRRQAKQYRNYKECDRIRDLLDNELVFVFDLPGGYDEIYYLTDKYFSKMESADFQSKRKFVEHRIREERESENRFKSWLFSMKASLGWT